MSWADDMGFDEYDGERGELELRLDTDALRLYWTTKDKQKIFLEDMETSHIENIVRAGIDGRLNCSTLTEHTFVIELSLRRRLQTPPQEEFSHDW